MPKFGQIIKSNVPILFDFHNDSNEPSSKMNHVLRNVAATIGDKGKVIKINIEKNNELTQALRINRVPTLMIYKSGEMVWRQSGELDTDSLVNIFNDFTY